MLITKVIRALVSRPERHIDPTDRLDADKKVEIVTPDGHWVTWAGKLSQIPEGRHERVHLVRRAPHSDRRIEPVLINVVSTPEAVFAAEIGNHEFNQAHGFAQTLNQHMPWQPQSVTIARSPGQAQKMSGLNASLRADDPKGE